MFPRTSSQVNNNVLDRIGRTAVPDELVGGGGGESGLFWSIFFRLTFKQG